MKEASSPKRGGILHGSLGRILLARLDQIGDVVLTIPLIRELRKNLPDSLITLIVNPRTFNLVETCPYVDEIIPYQYIRRKRLSRALFHFRLWSRRYDLAVLPRWDTDHYKGARTVKATKARIRVGYSEKVNAEKAVLNRCFDSCFTDLVSESGLRHEVERNLDILRAMGGVVSSDVLELWTTPEDERWAEEILGEIRVNRPLVAVSPGAGAPKRVWPPRRYLEVCRALARNRGARFAVLGGPGEEALGAFLTRELGNAAVDLVNRLTLRQLGAVLEKCSLFIGNDSGPMHVAAAAGVPVVEVSCHPPAGDPTHANSPARFAPWGVPSAVVRPGRAAAGCVSACRAEAPHCILNIETGEVLSAAVSLPWKTPS